MSGERSSTTSKFLIVFIVSALFLCLVVILIWLNVIGNRKERAVEALKSGINTVGSIVQPSPVINVSDYEMSVDSIRFEESEKKISADSVASESISVEEIKEQINAAPAVAHPLQITAPQTPGKVRFVKYEVKEGDTLASIAEANNLRTQTLISVNSLKTVYPGAGSVLLIPNQDGQFYTVQENDTFFSIAQRFALSVSWKTLKEINGLTDENITPGMLLFIPYSTPAKPLSSGLSAVSDDLDFVNPVFDCYIYGKYDQNISDPLTQKNTVLDGILIQTISSSEIRVSEDGFVVDKGVNEFNRTWFIKVSHSNGYTTYYDYLNESNVEIGQKLSKGSKIGIIREGNTLYDIPTLFFRIEQDGISLDPLLFFE